MITHIMHTLFLAYYQQENKNLTARV